MAGAVVPGGAAGRIGPPGACQDGGGRPRRKEREMDDGLYELGLAKRRKVLGDDYVDRALTSADDFNREFQRFVTEYCWGSVWGAGEALSDRQRSLNTLCILAALNRTEELELHFRGALRNGCTLAELRETLIQVAVYAGVPAGVSAFRVARHVLAEEGVDTTGATG
jgi:4-carboxymuconolactone decarboxylase